MPDADSRCPPPSQGRPASTQYWIGKTSVERAPLQAGQARRPSEVALTRRTTYAGKQAVLNVNISTLHCREAPDLI